MLLSRDFEFDFFDIFIDFNKGLSLSTSCRAFHNSTHKHALTDERMSVYVHVANVQAPGLNGTSPCGNVIQGIGGLIISPGASNQLYFFLTLFL